MKNKFFQKITEKFKNAVIDDKKRVSLQYFTVFSILGGTSLLMTVINLVTGRNPLAVATAVFAAFCVLNIILYRIGGVFAKISEALFVGEIAALFVFFVVTGNPDGFSAIWIAMLPSFGLLLFRLGKGSLFSFVMFLVLAFLFWTPIGRSLLMYDYNSTFLMRFPLLYLAFFSLAFLLEIIRNATYSELVRTRADYERLYDHDALTGIYNRYGFRAKQAELLGRNGRIGFAMLDIDDFKAVNDTYGHNNGDEVIKEFTATVREVVGKDGELYRWGGEEFIVLFDDAEKAEEICRKILSAVREREFVIADGACRITVSIGLVLSFSEKPDENKLISQADANLYAAKETGKDKMTVSEYSE